VVGDAGRNQRSLRRLPSRKEGHRVDTLSTQDSVSFGAAEPIVGGGSVRAGDALASRRVEENGTPCRSINALSVVSKILVAAAGLLVDTLAVNDAVLSGVADKAKPIAVHAGTVLRLLHADSLNADLACLADSILKGASAGIVQVPAADALFAVSGLDIVTFTVLICFETGSIAELLPSLAASERAGDLKAGSAYHNFVFVLAGKTISGEGVVGGAERRHKLAEDPES
jgi:hypothetical protein